MPALRRRLLAFATLAVAFAVLSAVVAFGSTSGPDHEVQGALAQIWWPPGAVLWKAYAVLGGIEATSALMLGLIGYLWRTKFRREAWIGLAFVIAEILEVLYKKFVVHPGPPPTISHGDGPSVADLILGGSLGNSFPSGHMLRTVLVYGLLGFAVHRLAPPGWLQRLAIPAAALIAAVMAFDRVYLAVHWESDVIGGLLLGGICLAGALIWLDRPLQEEA